MAGQLNAKDEVNFSVIDFPRLFPRNKNGICWIVLKIAM